MRPGRLLQINKRLSLKKTSINKCNACTIKTSNKCEVQVGVRNKRYTKKLIFKSQCRMKVVAVRLNMSLIGSLASCIAAMGINMLYDLQWKTDAQCLKSFFNHRHCSSLSRYRAWCNTFILWLMITHCGVIPNRTEQCVANCCNLPADLFSLLNIVLTTLLAWRLLWPVVGGLIWMESSCWSKDFSFEHVCVDKEVNLLLLNSNNWRGVKWCWSKSKNKKAAEHRPANWNYARSPCLTTLNCCTRLVQRKLFVIELHSRFWVCSELFSVHSFYSVLLLCLWVGFNQAPIEAKPGQCA